MSEVDRQIERSAALLERVSERYRGPSGRSRRAGEIGRRLTRIAVADALILLAAVIGGTVIGPMGLMIALGVIALMLAVTLWLALAPTAPPPSPAKLRETPLTALPARTAQWLDAQRRALPAPAMPLLDAIEVRLDTLAPQLATLDAEAPIAAEIRTLMGERLPDFVAGYARVPANLRQVARNGATPDAQLVEGLKRIEEEMGDISQQLAQGDLDQLETQRRFLEIKYGGDAA